MVTPLLQQTTALNPAQSLQEKNGDYRVFMMNGYSTKAREIICEVKLICTIRSGLGMVLQL